MFLMMYTFLKQTYLHNFVVLRNGRRARKLCENWNMELNNELYCFNLPSVILLKEMCVRNIDLFASVFEFSISFHNYSA